MQKIVEQIPEMPNEKLAPLWYNAIRILAKPKDKRRKEALAVLDAVSDRWRRNVADHNWFPWPTTNAPGGSGNLRAIGWPDEGMLRYLGYHVGETNPTPKYERRLILEYAFERDLPPLNDPGYYSKWGQPRTPRRLETLANTIAALVRNAKRRDPVLLRKAINDWQDDLDFMRQKYYVGLFNFDWPTTAIL